MSTSDIPTPLLADTGAPICFIPSAEAFAGLDEHERFYAHHMCRASFYGARILLRQTSRESEAIFDLIIALYGAAKGNWNMLADASGVASSDLELFLEYAAMFLSNVGNYRSTGDTKFIPRIDIQALKKLCRVNEETGRLFQLAAEGIYSKSPYQYGFPSEKDCASGYYPSTSPISKDEVNSVDKLLTQLGLLPENTRLSKNGNELILHIASSETSWNHPLSNEQVGSLHIRGETGDFGDVLSKVIEELNHAQRYARNGTQKSMISELILSFKSGDHQRFKSAQSLWVQDRSPSVETVIGFIETYQDPQGIRGAWEGIVAVVNKTQSKKFAELVERSSQILVTLPWNGKAVGLGVGTKSVYETTQFVKPDFTSLDTIGFTKSESPAGLNLPNFEDICQTVGSKNLEFGNVNNANPPDEKIPFIRPDELNFVRKYREKAFEVMVACHELLGHGSGRLFVEHSEGKANFSMDDPPIDPISGERIQTWYKPGETWSSVFGADANAIEECRADGVALILLTNQQVLDIFGFYGETAEDVIYAGYLTFIYGAIKGLSRWNPGTKKWGQSHRRGKFALLSVLLEIGPSLIEIVEIDDDIHVVLDRNKIISHAVPALKEFLLVLQVRKSTADVAKGVAFFERYSQVNDKFAKYRSIVLAKEPPRIQYVQPNTIVKGDEVILQEYEATKEGLIKSWAERGI